MNIQKQAVKNPFLVVGEYTYGSVINIRRWGYGEQQSRVRIGKFCSLADNITIFLGGNHRLDWISTYAFPLIGYEYPYPSDTKGDVVIENDVWIGAGVTIMSGISIGSGAAIGACSVVASSIPPYCVAAGNPAKVIRQRFADEIVKWLLDICWWNWPIDKIKKYGKFLASSDIQGFMEELAKG